IGSLSIHNRNGCWLVSLLINPANYTDFMGANISGEECLCVCVCVCEMVLCWRMGGYMHVCMVLCVYVCACVYMCMCVHACVYVCMCERERVRGEKKKEREERI